MPHPDDKLTSLQRRIDEAKDLAGIDKPEEPSVGPEGSGRAVTYVTELFAGILVGGTIGYFADRWLNTSPVLFIVFFFLGGAAGVRNMMHEVKDEMNTDKENT